MEVTPVSPSPTSPTAGDDLCDIDVTNVAIHIVTLLISLCGLVGNGAVLCLLSLKKGNGDIFDLAFADFLFLLFTVPSALLFQLEDVSCSPLMPLPYLGFLFQLSGFCYHWVLFRLNNIHIADFVDDLWELCFGFDLPARLWWLVDSVEYWAFFTLFTAIPAVTNLCPSHLQEHCRIATNYVHTLILHLFAAPILASHTIDFIDAKRDSRKKQTKRRSILVITIVLFVLLLSYCDFLQQLGYTVVSYQVVFLLNCIHSSIKPFIYFLAGGFRRPCSLKSLRLSLQRVFDEQEEKDAHSNEDSTDTET